jgi:aminoglycoside phosphotransferase (APT) family kinase protein
MTPATDGPAGATTTDAWPRSARLDAPHVIDRIAEITGVRLILEGPCPGGEVGAAYVRWPDGRRSVLTEGRSRAAQLLDLARDAGIPTARYELSAHVDGTRVVVQRRLPGAPPATVDAALVDAMVRLNLRFTGLLTALPAVPDVDLFLTGDGPGFCLHQPLRSYGLRAARLLDWIHDVGATAPDCAGDDLVHLDYHPGNILVIGDRITGVVDWDGARRGDRHFDLVTLRFHLGVSAPHLAGPLDERLAAVLEPGLLRAYWAHMALRQVDWSIRHHDAETVDRWLTVAEAHVN